MRSQAGFTLIELIATTVLLGFIAVFGTIFLTTGIRGAVSAQQAEENGQKAQIALERIALELRDINGGVGAGGAMQVLASPVRMVYTSSLPSLSPGTRTLAYNSAAGTLTLTPTSGGTAYTLVDGVTSCAMSFTGTGSAGTGSTVTLTVTFALSNSPGSFSITIKPRNTSVTPVTS